MGSFLSDRKYVVRAIQELEDNKYDFKYFNDAASRATRRHILNVMRLLRDEGPEALNRNYRAELERFGSSSLLLGIFLWRGGRSPYFPSAIDLAIVELEKQWKERPFATGILLGLCLVAAFVEKHHESRHAEQVNKVIRVLDDLVGDGKGDRGLTCFWILLKGYVAE